MIARLIQTQTTPLVYLAPWHCPTFLQSVIGQQRGGWLRFAQCWDWGRANALESHHARAWARAVAMAAMPAQIEDCPF